jgi:CTP:molybdopterin cytidylyltransferase MocA
MKKKTAGIMLAAGASRRLGQPKQDIRLGGEILLDRTLRIATLAGLDPVYAVVEPGRALASNLAATVLINPDAAEGMASSIRSGVRAASQSCAEGVVILACDQPAVTAEHLRELIEASDHGTRIVGSGYAQRKGVPAYFPASAFAQLLELRGDTGARDLLVSAHAIPLANGELDIDTREDLARARTLYPVQEPSADLSQSTQGLPAET